MFEDEIVLLKEGSNLNADTTNKPSVGMVSIKFFSLYKYI